MIFASRAVTSAVSGAATLEGGRPAPRRLFEGCTEEAAPFEGDRPVRDATLMVPERCPRQLQKGAFSSAVRTEDRDDIAPVDGHRDIYERDDRRPAADVQFGDVQHAAPDFRGGAGSAGSGCRGRAWRQGAWNRHLAGRTGQGVVVTSGRGLRTPVTEIPDRVL